MKDQYDLPQKLENQVQHYQWGSKTLIPELLGIPNPQEAPFAEIWMGVHPRGPSKIVAPTGAYVELSELLSNRSIRMIGSEVSTRFDNGLPFLFKVLAAGQPLSIQAHPNQSQAREGFADEEARGIAVDAFERNYRDRNHKPEIICALTPFIAMCGFREPAEIDRFYQGVGSRVYRDVLRPAGLPPDSEEQEGWIRGFFQNLMNLSTADLEELDKEVHTWALSQQGIITEADLILVFHSIHPRDAGVQAPFFLNVVKLKPGEALYQPAGVLHAYVEGMGIEVMANSDNVLRGGLTAKHVDVTELLKVLSFRPRSADIVRGIPIEGGGRRYDVPVEEFVLFYFSSENGDGIKRGKRTSIDIGICTEGELFLIKNGQTDERVLHIVKGESFLVPWSFGEYSFTGKGSVYIASVPGRKNRESE